MQSGRGREIILIIFLKVFETTYFRYFESVVVGGDVRDRTAVLKLIFYDVYMLREVV